MADFGFPDDIVSSYNYSCLDNQQNSCDYYPTEVSYDSDAFDLNRDEISDQDKENQSDQSDQSDQSIKELITKLIKQIDELNQRVVILEKK
jgi:hypothetical protein